MIINVNGRTLVNTDNVRAITIEYIYEHQTEFDVVACCLDSSDSKDNCYYLLTNVSYEKAAQEIDDLCCAWGRGEPVYVIDQEDSLV
jgi:hypothetical protein